MRPAESILFRLPILAGVVSLGLGSLPRPDAGIAQNVANKYLESKGGLLDSTTQLEPGQENNQLPACNTALHDLPSRPQQASRRTQRKGKPAEAVKQRPFYVVAINCIFSSPQAIIRPRVRSDLPHSAFFSNICEPALAIPTYRPHLSLCTL